MQTQAFSGSFYTATLYPKESTDTVKSLLKGRNYFICSKNEDYHLVTESRMEKQNSKLILDFVKKLSQKSRRPIVSYMIHDSDVLWLVIYKGGKEAFILDNTDKYFSGGKFVQKESVNIPKLFSIDKAEWNEKICEEKFEKALFADEFLFEIMRVLKLPDWAVGLGYNYLKEDEDFRSEAEDSGIIIEEF